MIKKDYAFAYVRAKNYDCFQLHLAMEAHNTHSPHNFFFFIAISIKTATKAIQLLRYFHFFTLRFFFFFFLLRRFQDVLLCFPKLFTFIECRNENAIQTHFIQFFNWYLLKFCLKMPHGPSKNNIKV